MIAGFFGGGSVPGFTLGSQVFAQSQAAVEFLRFWTFQDGVVRTATLAMLCLGISCGVLGSFIVLRRLSLVGDSLGHAVLPGVCLGFMVTWSKNPFWLFFGAVLAALLASGLIGVVQRSTRLKPDVAMGLVLSGFFGFGLVLLSYIQSDPRGGQGGLTQFFYGQAAAISDRDLKLIFGVTLLIVVGVVLSYRELAISSFDEEFAFSVGIPTRLIHYLLMTLTGFAIVISIQAVGVVLLSAMLITPAATALLLSDRLGRVVGISVVVACLAGVVGLNVSAFSPAVLNSGINSVLVLSPVKLPESQIATSLPTGPVVVLLLSLLFLTAFLLSPRHGVVSRGIQRWRRRRETHELMQQEMR